MNTGKTLSVFVHLLALTGYATLFSSGGTSIFLTLLFVLLLLTSFFLDFSGKKYLLSNGTANLLAVTLILFLLAGIFIFHYEVINLLIQFIVYIQLIKFLGKKDLKDYEQIILLSIFQLLAGAVTTTQIYYGILLAVFILISIITIILFNIEKEQSGIKDGIKQDPLFRFYRLFGSSVLIWIIIILFSFTVFLLMPRFKGNFLSSSLLNKERLRTGFNEEIELGKVGEIKKDGSPVMRVKFLNKKKDELPEILYWRGVALDYFDGKFWVQSFKNNKKRVSRDYDGIHIVSKNRTDDLAKQEIVVQPMDTEVLFAANLPAAFGELPFRNIYSINNSYYHQGHYTNNIKYHAYSNLEVPGKKALIEATGKSPDNLIENFTEAFNTSDEIKYLSDELFNENISRYENVIEVENYLKTNLRYTRVLDSNGDAPPIDQFLFEDHEGHCEYFATAMVVLLREMSIPSRLVTGFIGGEYNPFGEYFLIRESDAHAWVEVYFPEYGWVGFDPTPGSDSGLYQGFNLLTGTLEYLRYRWNRYVVDFDSRDQRRLFRNISNKSGKVNFQIMSKLKSFDVRMFLVFAVVIGLFFFLYSGRFRKIFSFINKEKIKNSEATETYKKSVLFMKKKGVNKLPHMTPNEFSDYVNRKGHGKYKDFTIITEIYNRLKYSGEEDKELTRKLKSSFKRLKRLS